MLATHFEFERAPLALLCALEIFLSAERSQAQAAAAQPPRAQLESAVARSGVVNINTAGSSELERLPGIGPARARAILELRARLIRFTRIEDLLRVRGIGRATFRKLRPFLSLNGETTLKD